MTASLRVAERITDPLERAVALTKVMEEDRQRTRIASLRRQEAILEARNQGVIPRLIGEALGVTTPRVSQLIKQAEEATQENILSA